MFNSDATPTAVKRVLIDLDTSYKTRNTKLLQAKAANLVKTHPDIAEQLAMNAHDDISVAVGMELIKKLNASHNYTRVIDVANTLATNLTEAGRAAQAASIYGKLSPEAVVRFAQTEINKYNKLTGKNIQLKESQAKSLTEKAKAIQKMPEGTAKNEALAQLSVEVRQAVPATLAEKLSSLQTMAQLLNPKTNIRNLGGNAIFAGLENISQTIATPVDALLSAVFRTDRTTALPSLKTQTKSFIKGGKLGIHEAKLGINTGPTTQYELSSVPVWRNGVLNKLEKTLNGTLRGGDRAAYTAAFDDSVRMQMRLAKTDKPTGAMLERAHHTGLYRTFQDTNVTSKFFTSMKRSLNQIGIGVEGKRFGLGDLVLKYPKTPGNLMARGIDYSPAGFVKAVFEASKPLFGREFNQKAFVDSFSRAVVGSGSAFGIGYAMASNGIITAQPEQNKDLRNVQKTAGLGGYQINVSGFKRWVASGFNNDAAKLRQGDKLVSYDWAQPIAIPISAGAAFGEKKPQKAGKAAVNTALNSVNTLIEQPLLQGVQKVFGGYGSLTDSVVDTVTSLPASFVPTAANQVNQLLDNKRRNLTAKNPAEDAWNQVRNKVPGLSGTLPEQYDVVGQQAERFQGGSNNAFNVFINPAFVSTYKPSDAAKEVIDLYQRTGETKQTPNTVPAKVTINGSSRQLSGDEQSKYQQYVGSKTAEVINTLAKDGTYQQLPDTEKIKLLSNAQTDINKAALIDLFGQDGSAASSGVNDVLAGSSNPQAKAQASADGVAVARFKTSNQKTQTIGDTFYYKTKDGTVRSKKKSVYDAEQTEARANLDMDRAKGSDHLATWLKSASNKYQALSAKRDAYDPETEQADIDKVTLQMENLKSEADKYQGYGGFTKPKKTSSGGSRKKAVFRAPQSNTLSQLGSVSSVRTLLKNAKVGQRA
jgi:hypothetical protein